MSCIRPSVCLAESAEPGATTSGPGPMPRVADVLSGIVAALALLASASGLLAPWLYRDNVFVASAWRGSDLVTLMAAVPALIWAVALARRGSWRARLVQLAMLDYTLYTYAYFLFGARFNELFLVYVALVTLSAAALIVGLADLDVEALAGRFHPRTPVRWVAGYMLAVATGLTIVYTAQSLVFIASGQVPPIVAASGHPTSLVFAIDLSLLVPGLMLGGWWLWTKRPWGYVLGAVLCVKGAIYTPALAIGAVLAEGAGVDGASRQAPFWVLLAVAGAGASLALLAGLRPREGTAYTLARPNFSRR